MAKEEEISKNLIKVLRDLSKKETEDKTFISKITQKNTCKESFNQIFLRNFDF